MERKYSPQRNGEHKDFRRPHLYMKWEIPGSTTPLWREGYSEKNVPSVSVVCRHRLIPTFKINFSPVDPHLSPVTILTPGQYQIIFKSRHKSPHPLHSGFTTKLLTEFIYTNPGRTVTYDEIWVYDGSTLYSFFHDGTTLVPGNKFITLFILFPRLSPLYISFTEM